MIIIETKKDDFKQGKAQLLVQFHAAHNNDRNIFGFITNEGIWLSVVYIMHMTFYMKREILISVRFERKHIAEVIASIHWMMIKGLHTNI